MVQSQHMQLESQTKPSLVPSFFICGYIASSESSQRLSPPPIPPSTIQGLKPLLKPLSDLNATTSSRPILSSSLPALFQYTSALSPLSLGQSINPINPF